MNQAVARAEEQRVSHADLEFEALVEAVTEHLDGDGAVTKTERPQRTWSMPKR